jgi:hypothetical protein
MSTTAAVFGIWLTATGPAPWDGKWPEQPARLPTIHNVPNSIIKPPPEYDHPYRGKLYISAENDLEAMALACGIPQSNRLVHACAQVPGWEFGPTGMGKLKYGECLILIAKRILVEQHYDYDMVIRHEQAHCNNWRHGIEVAEKPAWPRVIDKVADNQTEDAKTQKPSVEKKPRVKPAEKPAIPEPPWPLAAVAAILSTPLYIVAALTGRLR